jgi:hypothetical protein
MSRIVIMIFTEYSLLMLCMELYVISVLCGTNFYQRSSVGIIIVDELDS